MFFLGFFLFSFWVSNVTIFVVTRVCVSDGQRVWNLHWDGIRQYGAGVRGTCRGLLVNESASRDCRLMCSRWSHQWWTALRLEPRRFESSFGEIVQNKWSLYLSSTEYWTQCRDRGHTRRVEISSSRRFEYCFTATWSVASEGHYTGFASFVPLLDIIYKRFNLKTRNPHHLFIVFHL